MVPSKMVPSYAMVFIGDLEEKLPEDCDKKLIAWWRYIDDIFLCYGRMEKKNLKSF